MILDLFAQPLDVHVHGPGVAQVLVAPDVIQELFSGKHLVGGGREEVP